MPSSSASGSSVLSGGKVVFDGTPDHLTAEIVHQIYPGGLEDPGIGPRAEAARRRPQPILAPLVATATA
jgi:phosphonate transport system ATP-binding protein